MPRAKSWGAAVLLLPALALLAPAEVAAVERNSFAYAPPERPARGARSRYVDVPTDLAMEQIAARLKAAGFQVIAANPEERLVLAQYGGDPRDYLDCGLVKLLVAGKPGNPPKQYSADRPETRTYRTVRGRRVGLLREMRLDARLAVRVEPRGKGARVTSEAIYVATKAMSRLFKGGVAGPVMIREVVSFKSSEVGRFRKGTRCVSTGRLEELPLEPFKRPGENEQPDQEQPPTAG